MKSLIVFGCVVKWKTVAIRKEDIRFLSLENRIVRKAVVNPLPKNVCYRSWWRQTKPPPNESTTPTLKPLPMDRAPSKRRGWPVCLGSCSEGLGGVTPVHPYLSAASRFPKTQPKARSPRRPSPLSQTSPKNQINRSRSRNEPLRFLYDGSRSAGLGPSFR